MTDILETPTLTPVEIPDKTSAPNPFTDGVKELAGALAANPESKRALQFTVSEAETPTADEHDKLVAKRCAQLRAAGAPAGVTVKYRASDEGNGTRIVFWTVKRLGRKAKSNGDVETATPAKKTAARKS